MEGEIAVAELGRIMHEHDDGFGLVVAPNAQVFQPAHLFLVGESAGDEAVVDAHCALCFDGEEERFPHQGGLELCGGGGGGEVVVEPGGGCGGGGGVVRDGGVEF